ncbi:hypothetical protein P9705_001263 [Enterococcus faecalis]|nr:hypothetical protein [Enterococcus faecalis]
MIIAKFLRWLMPYKYLDEPSPKNIKKSKLTAKERLESGLLGVEVITINSTMSAKEARDRLLTSSYDRAYYAHSINNHQLAVKFKSNSAKRYQYRSDKHRKMLNPIIYPDVKVFDKTHIIPIGYHGSESDSRLLVGFSSQINRKDLRIFESKVAKINKQKEVLWFVNIEKQEDCSAEWRSIVWDAEGTVLLEGCWHDKSKFSWN